MMSPLCSNELQVRPNLCGDPSIRIDESVLDGCCGLHNPQGFGSDHKSEDAVVAAPTPAGWYQFGFDSLSYDITWWAVDM